MPGAPASEEALAGATLIVNASASPYFAGKGRQREQMLVQRARDNLCAVAFCNLVGGQDELVFDGHSVVIDHEGTVLARAPQFEEALTLCTVDLQARGHRAAARHAAAAAGAQRAARGAPRRRARAHAAPSARALGGEVAPLLEPEAEVYAALCLGVRDYVAKNGFEHVVLGLSGGIDSTLVALIAADALGADRVTARRDAVALLLRGHAERRARARGEPRHPVHRPADRAGDGRLRADARAGLRRAASPTSPRRTSRRGSAATC